MKKFVGNYFNLIPLYKEVMIGVWNLAVKVTSWVGRIMKKPKINLEFHFLKNGNQDYVKKMPL
jgi:hypothetical protein